MASAGKIKTYDAKVGNIYYKFDETDRTAMVTYMLYESRANCSAYSGHVVIPSSVRYNNVTYSVTAIDEWAFLCCGALTSIFIPSSIKSFGSGAFEECFGLQAVYISDLEAWCNISHSGGDSNPFYYARHIYLNGELIKNLEIPNTVKTIESNTFMNCTDLTSVTIPNSVTTIGSGAFSGCSGMTSVTIPNSISSIGNSAFIGCSGLISITIPKSVTSIGSNPFADCRSLRSISVESGNTMYDSREKCNAIIETSSNNLICGCKNTIIPNGVTSIGDCAFSGCSGLTSVAIPNSVTSIGRSAFSGCSGLTSVTIPNNVTSIEYSVFSGCSGMTSVIIPNNVTTINTWAFKGCSSLTSVTIPNSVTSIGYCAFEKCKSLTSIIVPKSVTDINVNAFDDCNNLQYMCFITEKYPSTQSLIYTTCQQIIPQKAYESGIPNDITHYATYSDKPMYVLVKSKTATSAVLELKPVDVINGGLKGNTYTVTLQGLASAASIKGTWKVDPFGSGIVNIPDVKTNDLVMSVQAAKAVSTTKARLSATVNEANDDKRYGFEWLRYDAPDNMTPNRVSAPLYNGQIVGTLSNLNPDIYYKYRPFYKADDGTMFQGEWEAFITGDANVFFEPEVHTKEPVALTKDGAQLSGVWVEGTEDIQEKGFEYWPKTSGARPATRGGHVTAIIVKGDETSVTLEGLDPGTEYVYRSYMRTASGTVYGEEMTFKTPLMGDANDDGKVNVADIVEINNAKAGNPSASFNMTNADTDGNGSLTEADITAIANIIVTKK